MRSLPVRVELDAARSPTPTTAHLSGVFAATLLHLLRPPAGGQPVSPCQHERTLGSFRLRPTAGEQSSRRGRRHATSLALRLVYIRTRRRPRRPPLLRSRPRGAAVYLGQAGARVPAAPPDQDRSLAFVAQGSVACLHARARLCPARRGRSRSRVIRPHGGTPTSRLTSVLASSPAPSGRDLPPAKRATSIRARVWQPVHKLPWPANLAGICASLRGPPGCRHALRHRPGPDARCPGSVPAWTRDTASAASRALAGPIFNRTSWNKLEFITTLHS